jgi:hypothetical protein
MWNWRASLALLLLGGGLAEAKRVKHPLGFSVDLPAGWTVENGEAAMAVIPPGVTLDPNREDNAEIYTIWAGQEGENSVEGVRANLVLTKTKFLAADEQFKMKNAPATIHTFDFEHPERKVAYRIRVVSMVVKGRRLTVMATGHRDKLAARDKVFQDIARSVDVP